MERYVIENNINHQDSNVVDLTNVAKVMSGDQLNEFLINAITNTPKGWKLIIPACVIRIEENLIL